MPGSGVSGCCRLILMFIINCLPIFCLSLSSIILSSPSYSLVPHLRCVTVLYEVSASVPGSPFPPTWTYIVLEP